jgi:hypothetical protein
MSSRGLARRTELRVRIRGVDVSENINRSLISASFTDNESDATDDLRIEIEDRDGYRSQWLKEDLKGVSISAQIIQRNFDDDGKDKRLDCGRFEIDSISSNGPPSRIAFRATSLSHRTHIRCEKKTRAWENVRLSALQRQIAQASGLTAMWLSGFDPTYTRAEQNNESDIAFLSRLCHNAGIALKVTDNTIVMFDESEFEKRPTVATFRKGRGNISSFRFSTNLNDTVYGRSHVSYTGTNGETIEYTFTPRDADPDAPTLYINERVSDRNAARNLAMRRLRQKNKAEFSAGFTVVGDIGLVAGVTVNVRGFGLWDGKWVVERAVHNVTGSGHTTQVTLRRVIEEY